MSREKFAINIAKVVVLVVAGAGVVVATPASSQEPAAPPADSVRTPRPRDAALGRSRYDLVLVGSEEVDAFRSAQLVDGVARGASLLLRSASSLTPPLSRGHAIGFGIIAPQLLLVTNSAMPFSQNYGALWAGRGASTRALFGIRLETSHARVIIAPEYVNSANKDWILRHDFYAPPLPDDRSQYDLPYYVGNFTIDQPMRFGDKPIRRVDPGQSTALVSAGSFELGASTENEWWGPGLRNAIVLSNNAPGFPHLFFRTGRPLNTRLGALELRWLVGGLKESNFFDTVANNNTRSISAISAVLQPKSNPNLSIGVARSVYATAKRWNQIPWRWFDVFARTSPSENHIGDSTRTLRDHFYSLFARWVLPDNGLEVNVEWARLRFPRSLRDALIAPNHTQAYTIGAQWRSPAWRGGSFRLQTEITDQEQSATFRDGPLDSWYTSRRVIQGYTNRGEMLGASIGPGASTQWLAIDYLKPAWRIGAFGGRIRWNEDVHSNFGFPDYASYCNFDVSIYPGVRAAARGRFGALTADLTLQNRLNAFFQNAGGCPFDRKLDIRNNTLSISYSPFGGF